MRRVVSRVVFGEEPGTDTPDATLMAAAEALVPPGEGWAWNQALIEFGALHCTARRPACVVCPLQRDCNAFPLVQTLLIARTTPASPSPSQPFEKTTRYFRGRIVEALRKLPEHDRSGIDLASLGSRVREGFSDDDVPWLRGLVDGLQRDGLAVVAEDSPVYDAEGGVDPSRARVRLP
jgi:A/G-specific adenine glycosylase